MAEGATEPRAGLDARALARRDWLRRPSATAGLVTHDLHRDGGGRP